MGLTDEIRDKLDQHLLSEQTIRRSRRLSEQKVKQLILLCVHGVFLSGWIFVAILLFRNSKALCIQHTTQLLPDEFRELNLLLAKAACRSGAVLTQGSHRCGGPPV